MRVSLKAKLTALISLLVFLAIAVVSVLYFASLVKQALLAIDNRGQYVANEVFEQARAALEASHPRGVGAANPLELSQFIEETLAQAPGLNAAISTAIGTQNAIVYVSITDDSLGDVLVHSDSTQVGRAFARGRPFDEVLRAGLLRQLRVINGPPRIYEIAFPLVYGTESLDVRVGVSTVLVGDQLKAELKRPVAVSLAALLLVTLTAPLLSFGVLRPLETISLGVERMARGEFLQPLRIDRRDEWGALSSKLNLLGEQMRGEKAAFVALKDNLNQLFSKLTDGLMLFDDQDRLVLSTPAVTRFLGRSPDGLVRAPAAEVFAADSPLDHLLADCFRSRRAISQETVFTPSSTAEVRRAAVSVQFATEQGKSVATLVTLRDASTRAQLETQIDVTTKLAALGRLTSGVAHEVKNPLNAMVLQIEILKSKLEGQDERVRPQLKVLSDEIRRLDRVVRTFLDFNRPVELHPVETDVESLVREVFGLAEPQAKSRHVQLVFEPDGALPPVRLDRDLVKQALLNLILNGCQAMPSGGKLTVSPRALPQAVEIQIADEGTGIPPEVRPRIFSLFFTTKSGGTGIGLAMAYRIVQLHNGSIEFSSEVNQGTTFRVLFPA